MKNKWLRILLLKIKIRYYLYLSERSLAKLRKKYVDEIVNEMVYGGVVKMTLNNEEDI